MRMKKTFLMLTTAVAAAFITAVFLCAQVLNASRPVSAFFQTEMRIVLDAGHGGIVGGVVGRKTGIKESDLNLSITLCLKEVLEDMGFAVTLTRKTEAGLYGTPTKGFKKRDMERRKEIIEQANPVLVLSIHQNFFPSQSSRGGQVFYSKEKETSRILAESVQKQLNTLYAESGVKGRSVQAGKYYMLECTRHPSVIIECGFLSNAADESLLISEVWQDKFSHAVAAAVLEFLSDSTA